MPYVMAQIVDEKRLESVPNSIQQAGGSEEQSVRKEATGDDEDGTTSPQAGSKKKRSIKLPQNLTWIPDNWTWPKISVAIRCAVAAWISALLFLIPRVERIMGQV